MSGLVIVSGYVTGDIVVVEYSGCINVYMYLDGVREVMG